MNRILSFAVVIVAIAIFANDANAQITPGILGGGRVLRSGGVVLRGGGALPGGVRRPVLNPGLGFFNILPRPAEREILRPPYFAQFPPVYYGDVVPRNYGVSPYAARPGVMPVEGVGGVPNGQVQKIANPYFQPNEAPSMEIVPQPVEAEKDGEKKADSVKDDAKNTKSKKAPWDKDA